MTEIDAMDHAEFGDVVVLYGALRSGTTMMRLLLDGHPDIACLGETDFMFEHFVPGPGGAVLDAAALQGDRIFRDSGLPVPVARTAPEALAEMVRAARAKGGKKVHVLVLHRHLALFREMMPQTRIIHLVRDPRDVARSSIGMGWAGNTWYGVNHWINTEADWETQNVPADLVLPIRYEDFLQTPVPTLTRLCDFVGVAFDPVMLRLEERSSYEPLDPGLAYQWRRKQTAREISEVEAKIGPLLVARGYEPAGPPPALPGLLRRIQLWIGTRRHVWGVRIRRYGLVDSLTVALAQRLDLPGLGRAARARIDARIQANLK